MYGTEDLAKYYDTITRLIKRKDFSLSEIENMIPYEIDIYVTNIIKLIKEESNNSKFQYDVDLPESEI